MNRIERLEAELQTLKQKEPEKKEEEKKKGFKLPSRVRRLFNKARKKEDQVVIMYLTQKYDVKFLLGKIVQGDIVVINNKVHRLNPEKMFRFGKDRFYIHREIDRRAISNEYPEVQESTKDDTPLIKAVIGATQKKAKMPSRSSMILIGVVVVLAIVAYMVFG